MTKKYNTFIEAVGGAKFHSDIPQIALKDVMDIQLLVKEAVIIEDFQTKFGLSTFAIMLIEFEGSYEGSDKKIEGSADVSTFEHTLLCSGEVVVKKIRKALDKKLLPLLGTITYNGSYYDIL